MRKPVTKQALPVSIEKKQKEEAKLPPPLLLVFWVIVNLSPVPRRAYNLKFKRVC